MVCSSTPHLMRRFIMNFPPKKLVNIFTYCYLVFRGNGNKEIIYNK